MTAITVPSPTADPVRTVVIGAGYVGLVTAVGLALLGHRVHVVERLAERARRVGAGLPDFHEPHLPEALTEVLHAGRLTVTTTPPVEDDWDVTLIAVGTGTADHQGADLGQVEAAFAEIADSGLRCQAVVVRSTVPVGLCDRMAARYPGRPVASNPEYLQEGRALEQFLHPDRMVIGTRDAATQALLERLLAPIGAPLIVVDPPTAELSKLAANAFLGVRLSLINEVANVGDAFGVDVDRVSAILGMDPRIGPTYLRAGLGFGGACLPKDMSLLAATADAVGHRASVVAAALATNDDRVERLIEHARAIGFEPAGARVAVLGLAFKPGTNDTRRSPGIALALALAARGADVVGHDPIVTPEEAAQAGVRAVAALQDALDGSDALFIALDARDYIDLDLPDARARMRGSILADGRGVVRAEQAAAAGFRYTALGRPGAQET